MTELIAGQYTAAGPPVAPANTDLPVQVDSQGRLLVVSAGSAPVGGGITWGAPQTVALTGASQTLIAANALRKGIQIINRSGNSQVSYDLSGGVVTLLGGIQMIAGFQRDWFTGSDCPVGAITIIGTTAQSVTYVEGT